MGHSFPFVRVWHGSAGDRLQILSGQSIKFLHLFDQSQGLVAFLRGKTMDWEPTKTRTWADMPAALMRSGTSH